LLKRDLIWIELIISDDHAGLKKARQAVLPGTAWQRCYFHLAQNAQSYAPSLNAREGIGAVIREESRVAISTSPMKQGWRHSMGGGHFYP